MAAGVEYELKQSDMIKAYNLCKKANVPVFAKWVRTFYETAFDAGMEYALKDAAVIEYEKAVDLIGQDATERLISKGASKDE